MFTRSLARAVALKRVCTTSVRSFGAHAHIEPHMPGTHESDYIMRRIGNSLPPPPGTAPRKTYITVLHAFTTFVTFAGLYALYQISKDINVEVAKIDVTDPLTGETITLYKPIDIMRPDRNMFGYNVVSTPNHDYSLLETHVAAQMYAYNQEMDLWVNARKTCPPLPASLKAAGVTEEEFLANYVKNMLRHFKYFNPTTAAQPKIDAKMFITEEFLEKREKTIASRNI